MEKTLGFSNFMAQIDAIGMSVLLLLLALSIASWYLIIIKSIGNMIASRRAKTFLKHFWHIDSISQLKTEINATPNNHAFAQLAKTALTAIDDSQKYGLKKLTTASNSNELLTRSLRNSLDQEAARIEYGLTIIASAGSASPYIGLFGTVWGIYHALIQIGMTGQGTLDKVAGPVGEALIMTALGLAVAIPAVLAYNAFIRRNRLWMAKLDDFAHDLYTILAAGNKSNEENALSQTSQNQTSSVTQQAQATEPVSFSTGVTSRERH